MKKNLINIKGITGTSEDIKNLFSCTGHNVGSDHQQKTSVKISLGWVIVLIFASVIFLCLPVIFPIENLRALICIHIISLILIGISAAYHYLLFKDKFSTRILIRFFLIAFILSIIATAVLETDVYILSYFTVIIINVIGLCMPFPKTPI